MPAAECPKPAPATPVQVIQKTTRSVFDVLLIGGFAYFAYALHTRMQKIAARVDAMEVSSQRAAGDRVRCTSPPPAVAHGDAKRTKLQEGMNLLAAEAATEDTRETEDVAIEEEEVLDEEEEDVP